MWIATYGYHIGQSSCVATYQFSLIWDHFPHLPHSPSFQNDWNVEACAIQIVIFKFNPQYKEKASHSHKEPRWWGWVGGGIGLGASSEIYLSGSQLGWHQAWVTSVPSQEGKGKLWTWASASQLTRNESDSHSGVYWRAWSKVASAQIAGCDDKSWAPSSILSPND